MNTGMLWFDNDPKTSLADKVQKAAEHYREKYGAMPDMCMVNPSMLAESEAHVGRVLIRPMRSIMPGHLWIGVEERLPVGAD
jgi:hypothetical protein